MAQTSCSSASSGVSIPEKWLETMRPSMRLPIHLEHMSPSDMIFFIAGSAQDSNSSRSFGPLLSAEAHPAGSARALFAADGRFRLELLEPAAGVAGAFASAFISAGCWLSIFFVLPCTASGTAAAAAAAGAAAGFRQGAMSRHKPDTATTVSSKPWCQRKLQNTQESNAQYFNVDHACARYNTQTKLTQQTSQQCNPGPSKVPPQLIESTRQADLGLQHKPHLSMQPTLNVQPRWARPTKQ